MCELILGQDNMKRIGLVKKIIARNRLQENYFLTFLKFIINVKIM